MLYSMLCAIGFYNEADTLESSSILTIYTEFYIMLPKLKLTKMVIKMIIK
jgi:hypothetical protein